MKETTLNLYALDYRDMRTYMVAMLFILGNMVLPQLCHLIPQGGITWLPIYFFTLIGAYKYGWKVPLVKSRDDGRLLTRNCDGRHQGLFRAVGLCGKFRHSG